MAEMAPSTALPISREETNPNGILKEYFLQSDPIYRELNVLREKGDEHFKKQRERADNADHQAEEFLYKMMPQIAGELHDHTGGSLDPLMTSADGRLHVLDLCMAPGGFSACALAHNPRAVIRGISLPRASGGHQLLLNSDHPHYADMQCQFLDITMLASEFGVNQIPKNHPEHHKFLSDRPIPP
ncbi:MAG: hypothetical protein Q9227_002733 [Pyrenula ochraceoflavens]